MCRDVILQRAVPQRPRPLRSVHVPMHHDVQVRRPSAVVAGEEGVELRGAGGRVQELCAAEPGVARVGLVGRVAVVGLDDATVHARRVGAIELDIGVGNGGTSSGVDYEEVEMQGDAGLVFDEVGADVFARDVVRALGGVGGEQAGVVSAKDGGDGCGQVKGTVGVVVDGQGIRVAGLRG